MPRGRPGITPKDPNAPKKVNSGRYTPGNPGPGRRPKGSRNKYSGEIKAQVLEALQNAASGYTLSSGSEADGVDYLIQQARQVNPSPFMSLLAKCITQSTDIKATVDGRFTWGPVRENWEEDIKAEEEE